MTPTDLRAPGDHEPDDAAHGCDCSIVNANENHALVIALAERHGVDLCLDEPAEDENDDIADLRLLHDVFLAQGAHCEGDDLDDGMDEADGHMDDDATDASGEFDVSRFSDAAEFDGDDEAGDSADEFDLDIIDLDDDADAPEFADAATADFAGDAVTTPPVDFA